jgi:hypothetical protein
MTSGSTSPDIWDRVSAGTPAPGLALVVAAGVLALGAIAVPEVWDRARHLVTMAHEGSHGVVALLSGRRLSGIRLQSDSSGLTVSTGRSGGAGAVLTLAAGYVGPGLVGLGAACLLTRGHAAGVLWGLLVLLGLMLLGIRSLFGLWAVLAAGAALFTVTRWAPAELQLVVAYVVTWFLLLAAPRDVVGLHRSRRAHRDRSSDAAALARLTHLPGAVWVGFFLVATLGCLLLGGRLLVTAA